MMMLAMVSSMMLSIGDDVDNDGCHDDGDDVDKLLGDVIHDNKWNSLRWSDEPLPLKWWSFTNLLVCVNTKK